MDSGDVLYAPELVQAHLKGVFNTHHGPRRRFVPQNVLSGGALGKKVWDSNSKLTAKNNSDFFHVKAVLAYHSWASNSTCHVTHILNFQREFLAPLLA